MGVVGALEAARNSAMTDVIAMDMGGTSLDVCLSRGNTLELNSEGSVGGYPVKIPQIDVHTIGAGGGSIARVEGGLLKVGPRSAGAVPGPACYGKGERYRQVPMRLPCSAISLPNALQEATWC